jgi:peptidoglycan/xylan/chitin deacetylase (PgdA/CDA1 family)
MKIHRQLSAVCMLLLFTTLSVAQEDQRLRRIAFTFDDIPRGDGPIFTGPQRAEALIAALRGARVEGAMMFVQTDFIERRTDGAQRLRTYQQAGHVLASHSHTHPWLSDVGPAAYLADIDEAASRLAAFADVAPYFRYPFLDEGEGSIEQRDSVRAGLADRALRNGYVTVDTYDWFMASLLTEAVAGGYEPDVKVLCSLYTKVLVDNIEFYDGIALGVLGRSPAHVLLLHENDLAALCVDDLAAALVADGWQIVPALVAFSDPIAEREPDTLFLGQGRVAALAHEAGWLPRDLIHESEDESYLRDLFIENGILLAD